MIVVTHFAAYCLTFIWQYLKRQYAKINLEDNEIILIDNVEHKHSLGLTFNKADDENLYKENNPVIPDNCNLARIDDLNNRSIPHKINELSLSGLYSEADSVESSLHLSESKSKLVEKEIVPLLSEKSTKVQPNECIFLDGPKIEINQLVSPSQSDKEILSDNVSFTEWKDGELVLKPISSIIGDINTTETCTTEQNQGLVEGSQEDLYKLDQQAIKQDSPIFVLKQTLHQDLNKEGNEQHFQELSICEAVDLNTGTIPESSVADVECKTQDIRFYPPVYVQRYVRAGDVLDNITWKSSRPIKKVVEFGCAEMTFFTMVLKYKQVAEIIEVDIDGDLLDKYIDKVCPKPSDFLAKRTTPLTVKVYAGNVAQVNSCLIDTDAVIAIELIEHLYPDDLEGLPFTIFGFMQPRVALFTTPNADFNILFPNFSGFRHDDHKFEWTRNQFEDWANNLVSRYSDYEVSFEGIGEGPEGTEALGCCSQMALFVRKTESKKTVDIADNKELEGEYKLIHDTEYPFYIDMRSEEQKILDSAESYIYRCRNNSWNKNYDRNEILLNDVLSNIKCLSLVRLRDILVKANWNIVKSNNGNLMVKYPESEDEISDWDENNVQEYNYELSEPNKPIEENWDDLECGKPWDTEQLPEGSVDIIDRIFNTIEEIESSTNIADETLTYQLDSENDTTLENKSILNISPESNITNQGSLYLPHLKIPGHTQEQNSSSNTQVCSPIPKPNALYKLPSYHDVQQTSNTPLKTPSKKSEPDAYSCKNLSCLSDCINDSNVSGTDVSNVYKSCSDESDSETFYTPMPIVKHFPNHGPIPSFKSAISASDLNESEDSLSPSENNISFTNLKSQIPKCHSCPGSRQSVSAEELQRGSSCDILACQQDSASISKAGDSGYPNSNSEQTMDMDLTPEQVEELFTESDSSLGCDEDNSLPESPINPGGGQVIALLGDNVENGDVANNNRDGEGNNVIGEIDGELLEFEAIIDEREEVHPLLAAVEGDPDSSDNELDENKNSDLNENNDSEIGLYAGTVDCPQACSSPVKSLSLKPLVCSDLCRTKSEPILIGNTLEETCSNELKSSTSNQSICFKILDENAKEISPSTFSSRSIDNISKIESDTTTCSNVSRHIIPFEPLIEKKLFNEETSSHNDHINDSSRILKYEDGHIKEISSSPSLCSVTSSLSNFTSCSDPSVSILEPFTYELYSNKSCNQLSSSSFKEASTSSPLLCMMYNKTKEDHCSYSELKNLASDQNSDLTASNDLGNTKSEPTMAGKDSEYKSLNKLSSSTCTNGHLHENSKHNSSLSASSHADCDIFLSNNFAFCDDKTGTKSIQGPNKKTIQTSFDDLSWSSSNPTIGSNELFNIDSADSIDLTPLPSACAIMEDLLTKDSQMTLCSEISSTIESNVFETSSESSLYELSSDYNNQQIDNDIQLPEDANIFPEWLLSIYNSSSEDSFVNFGYGDVEDENDEILEEEREGSYDVQGDIGGSGDINISQS